MTTVAKQVGNAVPPQLARTLAEALAVALDDAGTETMVEAAA